MLSHLSRPGLDWLRQKVRQRRAATMTRHYLGQAERYEPAWRMNGAEQGDTVNPMPNFITPGPLSERSVHKWMHYFDIYHRHLANFQDKPIHFLEIGLDRGGSLDMWRSYLGPRARYYGVDIEPSYLKYKTAEVKIFIGDQADRNFWSGFRRQVPDLDVVIEDGGHKPEQQIVSLEELLPHLRPGGIYICEDIHGECNDFAVYAGRLMQRLHRCSLVFQPNQDPTITSLTSSFQKAVHSIHFYPFMLVIERNRTPLRELTSRRLPTPDHARPVT